MFIHHTSIDMNRNCMKPTHWFSTILGWLLCFLSLAGPAHAVPMILSFQGKVLIEERVYEGVGRFAFAIVDGENPDQYLWSHASIDPVLKRPASFLDLEVRRGIYQVGLGDPYTMSPFPAEILQKNKLMVRVWFDDGVHGVEQLAPDAPIHSVVFSMKSKIAETVENLPDGIIQPQHLGNELVAELQWLRERVGLFERSAILASAQPEDPELITSGLQVFSKSQKEPTIDLKDLSHLPSPRTFAGSSRLHSRWFVWGGLNEFGLAVSAGAVFDANSTSWSPLVSLDEPEARWQHLQIMVGDQMLVHGGRSSKLSTGLLASAGLYDTNRGRWKALRGVTGSVARAAHSGLHLPGTTSVLLFGGRTSQGFSNEFELYDVATDTFDPDATQNLQSLLTPREQSQMCLAGRYIIVWGGMNQGGALADGLRIDMHNSLTALRLPEGLSGRYAFSMTSIGDRIAIFGGKNTQGNDLDDGAIYDPVSNTWEFLPASMAVKPRHQHAGIWTGEELVVAGGLTGTFPSGDMHAFNPLLNQWRTVEADVPIPAASCFFANGSDLHWVTGTLGNNKLSRSHVILNIQKTYYFYKNP